MGRNDIPHPDCSGICKKYEAIKPPTGGRYASGQKRCQMCLVYMKYKGNKCPCCGYRLRVKSRSRKSKEKYDKITRI